MAEDGEGMRSGCVGGKEEVGGEVVLCRRGVCSREGAGKGAWRGGGMGIGG